MADPVPMFLVKPLITLGDDTAVPSTLVELQCSASNVDVASDQDETTAETFCAVFTNYKSPKFTITLTLYQSFGTDGIWAKLQPMFGTIQPFTLAPDADNPTGTIDNPLMFGTARVKYAPFLSGAVGEASDFDLELGVQGMPSYAPPDTPPTALVASSSSSSSSSSSV